MMYGNINGYSLAVTGKTSYICNTNRMSVMILAMRTDLRLRSTPFNSAVGRNNIMISTTIPAQRAVVAVNVRHSQCAASAVSAAMHNNQSYRSHAQMVLELRHGTTRRTRNNHFNHSQHIQCHLLPVNLHTRSL